MTNLLSIDTMLAAMESLPPKEVHEILIADDWPHGCMKIKTRDGQYIIMDRTDWLKFKRDMEKQLPVYVPPEPTYPSTLYGVPVKFVPLQYAAEILCKASLEALEKANGRNPILQSCE